MKRRIVGRVSRVIRLRFSDWRLKGKRKMKGFLYLFIFLNFEFNAFCKNSNDSK